MHKIDSNPAPKNWTLYYKDGIPVIGGAATDAKNKAKVQAWLDKYEVIEIGGIGNRVMNPGEYLPDAHLAALSS